MAIVPYAAATGPQGIEERLLNVNDGSHTGLHQGTGNLH